MKTQWKKIGEVGVDAGLLMIGDPCYFIDKDCSASKTFKSWSQFCDELGNKTHKQLNYPKGHSGLGVVASTRYGDGCYSVYGLFVVGDKDDRPIAMMVVTGAGEIPGMDNEG